MSQRAELAVHPPQLCSMLVPIVFTRCAWCSSVSCSGRGGQGAFRAMDLRKLLQTTPPTQTIGYLVCGLGYRTSPQHGTFQVRRLCLLNGQVCSHHHLDNGKLLKSPAGFCPGIVLCVVLLSTLPVGPCVAPALLGEVKICRLSPSF